MPGLPGDEGPRGEPGVAGTRGPTGYRGVQGEIGRPGAQVMVYHDIRRSLRFILCIMEEVVKLLHCTDFENSHIGCLVLWLMILMNVQPKKHACFFLDALLHLPPLRSQDLQEY